MVGLWVVGHIRLPYPSGARYPHHSGKLRECVNHLIPWPLAQERPVQCSLGALGQACAERCTPLASRFLGMELAARNPAPGSPGYSGEPGFVERRFPRAQIVRDGCCRMTLPDTTNLLNARRLALCRAGVPI